MSPRGPFFFASAIVWRRDAQRTNGVAMRLYESVGTAVGTREALDLARRLAVWHDAMVVHRRRVGDVVGSCEMDCPHEQAVSLWLEAVDVYGQRSRELEFLRKIGRAARQHDDAGTEELPF
jgi:hypothetical protein